MNNEKTPNAWQVSLFVSVFFFWRLRSGEEAEGSDMILAG